MDIFGTVIISATQKRLNVMNQQRGMCCAFWGKLSGILDGRALCLHSELIFRKHNQKFLV